MRPTEYAPTLGKMVIYLLTFNVADFALSQDPQVREAPPDWSFNATIIEACSCPMFCQCFFNSKPASHCCQGTNATEIKRFCRLNRAFKINTGNYGATKLDGVKFWMAADLGGDFSADQMDWALLIFEPSVSKQQRDAIQAVIHHLYPFQWNSFAVGKDAAMDWKATAERAEARLDGGKTAQVVLHKAAGMTTEPIVIKNLKYDAAPRNDGFILMPSEVEAYKVGNKAFEFKDTTGFMVTIDITSKDVKK